MKVYSYYEFLFEGNTPEDFINQELTKIKNRIDTEFNPDENQVKKMKDFKTYNIEVLDSDTPMNNGNKEEYSYKFKFTDDQNIMYIMNVIIKLEDALSQEEDLKITKAHVTFDKYGEKEGNYTRTDRLMDKIVDPSEINADFIMKLKMELDNDKNSNSDEEEFEIEYEKPQEESQIKEEE